MPNVYSWDPKRRKKYDAYPNLRTKTRRPSKSDGPPSRRTRMIYKALLRADRRWDAYGAKVRTEKLEWKESKKTQEWRLILQNGLLLRRLRKAKNVPEREERLGLGRSGEARESTT